MLVKLEILNPLNGEVLMTTDVYDSLNKLAQATKLSIHKIRRLHNGYQCKNMDLNQLCRIVKIDPEEAGLPRPKGHQQNSHWKKRAMQARLDALEEQVRALQMGDKELQPEENRRP